MNINTTFKGNLYETASIAAYTGLIKIRGCLVPLPRARVPFGLVEIGNLDNKQSGDRWMDGLLAGWIDVHRPE